MSGLLWGVQIALAALFIMAGSMKLVRSREHLASKMAWVEDHSEGAVRAIGGAEVLGGIGLVLPGLLNLLTWVTPFAALGLALLMLGAAWTHAKRGERGQVFVPVVLAVLSGLIAYSRFTEI